MECESQNSQSLLGNRELFSFSSPSSPLVTNKNQYNFNYILSLSVCEAEFDFESAFHGIFSHTFMLNEENSRQIHFFTMKI